MKRIGLIHNRDNYAKFLKLATCMHQTHQLPFENAHDKFQLNLNQRENAQTLHIEFQFIKPVETIILQLVMIQNRIIICKNLFSLKLNLFNALDSCLNSVTIVEAATYTSPLLSWVFIFSLVSKRLEFIEEFVSQWVLNLFLESLEYVNAFRIIYR